MTNLLIRAFLAGLLTSIIPLVGCGAPEVEEGVAGVEKPFIPVTCGDGVVQEGELCDDGPANSDSLIGACRLNCSYLFCEGTTYEAKSPDGTVACFEDVVYTGNVRIEKSNDLESLAGFTRIAGNMVIAGNIYSTVKLESLRRIDGNLWIWDTGRLVDFQLPELEEVGGDILIRNNNNLKDFGMGALTRVDGNLAIAFNSSLPTCIARGFADLVGEVNISGVVKIEGNQPDSCD